MRIFRYTILFFVAMLLFGVLSADVKTKIMLINSSGAVEKYSVAQEEFLKTIPQSVVAVDLSKEKYKLSDMEDLLYDEYPDLIYCIGTKAYLIANKFVSEKKIIFSSIINWRRLPRTKSTYGVSNELHPGFQITLFRYIFPKVSKIGVLYSEEYNGHWVRKARENANEMDVEIIAEQVGQSRFTLTTLKTLLPGIEALWLISDPVVIPDKETLHELFALSDATNTPVFSYHPTYVDYGASLVVSVDDPTTGRQAAAMVTDITSGVEMKDRVQLPAGSHIVLNLQKVKAYGIHFNEMALDSVNQLIE